MATVEELILTHQPEYVNRFIQGDQTDMEIRNVGLPWSSQGVDRTLSIAGGTIAATCRVCEKWSKQGQQRQQHIAPWSAHIAGGHIMPFGIVEKDFRYFRILP